METKMIENKVFCVGFQKTGTSSLRDALRSLGYKVAGVYGRGQDLASLQATYVEEGLRLAHEYDAVQDMPWPLIFRELDGAFPGSKFILLEREEESWFRSIAGHFGEQPDAMQELIYGADAGAPLGNKARYLEVYERHNEAVRAYFAERPQDFLVMNLQNGDGWNELGRFLGVAVPDGPFVKTNTAQQRRSLFQRIRGKLFKMGLPVGTMHG